MKHLYRNSFVVSLAFSSITTNCLLRVLLPKIDRKTHIVRVDCSARTLREKLAGCEFSKHFSAVLRSVATSRNREQS